MRHARGVGADPLKHACAYKTRARARVRTTCVQAGDNAHTRGGGAAGRAALPAGQGSMRRESSSPSGSAAGDGHWPPQQSQLQPPPPQQPALLKRYSFAGSAIAQQHQQHKEHQASVGGSAGPRMTLEYSPSTAGRAYVAAFGLTREGQQQAPSSSNGMRQLLPSPSVSSSGALPSQAPVFGPLDYVPAPARSVSGMGMASRSVTRTTCQVPYAPCGSGAVCRGWGLRVSRCPCLHIYLHVRQALRRRGRSLAPRLLPVGTLQRVA